MKEVRIGLFDHKVTKPGTSLSESHEEDLFSMLTRNIVLFVYAPSDMPGIYIRVVRHRLSIDLIVKLVSQRKHKVDEEKREAIDEEVQNMISINFITKVKHPSWLANIVLARKALNK